LMVRANFEYVSFFYIHYLRYLVYKEFNSVCAENLSELRTFMASYCKHQLLDTPKNHVLDPCLIGQYLLRQKQAEILATMFLKGFNQELCEYTDLLVQLLSIDIYEVRLSVIEIIKNLLDGSVNERYVDRREACFISTLTLICPFTIIELIEAGYIESCRACYMKKKPTSIASESLSSYSHKSIPPIHIWMTDRWLSQSRICGSDLNIKWNLLKISQPKKLSCL
jgi:hypothetical protein